MPRWASLKTIMAVLAVFSGHEACNWTVVQFNIVTAPLFLALLLASAPAIAEETQACDGSMPACVRASSAAGRCLQVDVDIWHCALVSCSDEPADPIPSCAVGGTVGSCITDPDGVVACLSGSCDEGAGSACLEETGAVGFCYASASGDPTCGPNLATSCAENGDECRTGEDSHGLCVDDGELACVPDTCVAEGDACALCDANGGECVLAACFVTGGAGMLSCTDAESLQSSSSCCGSAAMARTSPGPTLPLIGIALVLTRRRRTRPLG